MPCSDEHTSESPSNTDATAASRAYTACMFAISVVALVMISMAKICILAQVLHYTLQHELVCVPTPTPRPVNPRAGMLMLQELI